MKIAVWDTYVTRRDGRIMHFDIIAPESVRDTATIYAYGKTYLAESGEEGQPLTAQECQFCHVQEARQDWVEAILTKGYYIYEMENCTA